MADKTIQGATMSAVKAPRLLKTADCKQEHTISHVLSTNKSDNVLGLLNARQADAFPNCPSLRTSQLKHAHPPCVRDRKKCSVVAKHDVVGYEPEADAYKMDLVYPL